uniref:Uncharacterized protein n=1 Tax=Oreochromis niloticus TaxID=8128 RepID=A0A669DWE3_ORENI
MDGWNRSPPSGLWAPTSQLISPGPTGRTGSLCRGLLLLPKKSLAALCHLWRPSPDRLVSGNQDGGKEDGGKEDGSVGLKVGLSVSAVLLVAAVGFLIYRKVKSKTKQRQNSYQPPDELQPSQNTLLIPEEIMSGIIE